MRSTYFFAIILGFLSCTPQEEAPVVFPDATSYWSYYTQHTHLELNYNPEDSQGNPLPKRDFLDSLAMGLFIPVRKNVSKEPAVLKLQRMVDEYKDIKVIIKQQAAIALFFLNWEQKPFPDFSFRDVDGNEYNTAFLKNRTVLMKTYFIGCQACNEEMPALNQFAEKHPEFTYISLATDPRERLVEFLKGKTHAYHFVPEQVDFISKALGTNAYPAHFLVRDGVVEKVFNRSNRMIAYVEEKY